ncbi:hypothetical protein APHAL10511_007984 [Amanita phalloides]|nr:hypothetical protein APHAL10511_007984 [Amanita phalloides]
MKFLTASLFSLVCATVSVAQGVDIIHPKSGSRFALGHKFTVELVRNPHIQTATEIGIAIGVYSCPSTPCPPPDGALGYVMYAGPYHPESHGVGPQYQNFTVTLPTNSYYRGKAQLNVVRAFLIGAGPGAALGTASVPIFLY